MAIVRKIIWRQVAANCNALANKQYGSPLPASTAAQYDDKAIMDAVLNAEAFLFHRIAEAKYNGARTAEEVEPDDPLNLIKSVNVLNGALIPHHMGPVIGVLVDGQPAELAPATTVASLRSRNPLGLKLAGRLYGLEDNRLFFTTDNPGNPATVHVFQFDKPEFDSITEFFASESAMPPEYHQAWVDLATGYVMPRGGNLVQAGASYRGHGNAVALGELGQEQRLKSISGDSQKVGE